MEDNIKQAMVLWYDLKKQGATNESMAENPTLRDLSGNGHDATCYNFAWSGMSGVGGYAIDFNNWFSQSDTAWKITNKTYKTLIFKCINALTKELTYIIQDKFEKKNFSIQITSNNPELKFELISVFSNGTSNRIIQQNEDEVIQTDYTDEEFNIIDDVYPTLRITADTFSFLKKDDIITIEQLPLYPHALVSDGVDDYAVVTGIGLNSMKTIFVNMYLTSENREDFKFVFASRIPGSEDSVALAYKVDITAYNYRNSGNTYIDGTLNTTLKAQDLLDIKHIATLTNENGNSSTSLNLFRDSINQNNWCNVVLYSFIAFNRILTLEEIAWVKTNLIETEQ